MCACTSTHTCTCYNFIKLYSKFYFAIIHNNDCYYYSVGPLTAMVEPGSGLRINIIISFGSSLLCNTVEVLLRRGIMLTNENLFLILL